MNYGNRNASGSAVNFNEFAVQDGLFIVLHQALLVGNQTDILLLIYHIFCSQFVIEVAFISCV